jgi:hypothetical protein
MAEPNLELGRFAEPSLLILVSLSDGPKHGLGPGRCTQRSRGSRSEA